MTLKIYCLQWNALRADLCLLINSSWYACLTSDRYFYFGCLLDMFISIIKRMFVRLAVTISTSIIYRNDCQFNQWFMFLFRSFIEMPRSFYLSKRLLNRIDFNCRFRCTIKFANKRCYRRCNKHIVYVIPNKYRNNYSCVCTVNVHVVCTGFFCVYLCKTCRYILHFIYTISFGIYNAICD